MFDITQHSLGQGATQRAHAEVTPRGGIRSSKARRPSERKALEGGGHVLSPVSFSHWFQIQWRNMNEHLFKRRLNPTATGDGSWGSPPFIPPVFLHKRCGSRLKRWKILHKAVASLDDNETRVKA